MSTLFQNAIESIQLGIEDYINDDPKRVTSALRNYYAGILLLAKEVIIRKYPQINSDLLISAKQKFSLNSEGQIIVIKDGNRTIDFITIGKRFKELGIAIDLHSLDTLNDDRNSIEHFYTNKNKDKILEAITLTFPTVVQLFNFLEEKPALVLGESWGTMLQAQEFYKQESSYCKKSLSKINWVADVLGDINLICPHCSSKLVQQKNFDNTIQELMELSCRACGEEFEVEECISVTLYNVYEADAHQRILDGDDSEPLSYCPECNNPTYIMEEEICGICGCKAEELVCYLCGSTISLNEYAETESKHMCSHCLYQINLDD